MRENLNPPRELINPELGQQFSFPLLDQSVRGEDERIADTTEQELAQHHASLDRLSQAYLVSKQIPLNRVGENATRGSHLMWVDFYTGRPDSG
jgi:hypothetical protein